MAELRDFLPFQQAKRGRPRKSAQVIDVNDQKTMAKVFKAVGLALGFTGLQSFSGRQVNFETSPYDFDRIIQAIDTDSYLKQAFNKYTELLWKEGWTIVGENQEAVEYLYQRIDFMELSMQIPFDDFLRRVGDQLFKFHNCFVVKVRGNLKPFFPGELKPPKGEDPIIGYEIIPCETMEIKRDEHNRPVRYRQNIWNTKGGASIGWTENDGMPKWWPHEVIHFSMDHKPGYLYGTPFIEAVLDDVVALRQIEEDIQNLIHRELFPLYKYKVGTEEHPAEPQEVLDAAEELANLRTEGGLVLPDRHDVEVIGAEGKALEVEGPLNYFLGRVCSGLGISPHHLGLMMGAANRATTDRLDIALYDKVKGYQEYFADMMVLKIFNELLIEGGFDPYITPKAAGISDRCEFVFNEIDVDTQVKKENHILQKWTNNIMEMEEARIALGLEAQIDEQQTFQALMNRLTPQATGPGKPIAKPGENTSGPVNAHWPTMPTGDTATAGPGATPVGPSAGGTANKPVKPDAATPSTGGRPNLPNKAAKQAGQKSRPANQFGRKTSPGIRHSDDAWLTEVASLLDDDEVT